MSDPLIEVRDLVKEFPIKGSYLVRRQLGAVHAVDGVSFDVQRGETFGIVGESGCGKSTLARMVTMIERPTAGHLMIEGTDIVNAGKDQLHALRPEQNHFGQSTVRLQIGRIDLDGAFVDVLESGEHAQRGALARTRRTDQHDELAVGDVEVERVGAEREPRVGVGLRQRRDRRSREDGVDPDAPGQQRERLLGDVGEDGVGTAEGHHRSAGEEHALVDEDDASPSEYGAKPVSNSRQLRRRCRRLCAFRL
mgnify:CR=1 FL=1